MEKFILERLHPVTLSKGRASQKKERLNEDEKTLARQMTIEDVGHLN